MPNPRVIHYGAENYIQLPVSGGGTDLVIGQLMKRGPTAGTNTGFLVQASTNSAHADMVGILQEAHTASGNDTDTAGTVFKTRPVDLIVPTRVVRMTFSVATADLISVTQAVNTTTITLTSLEDDIDAAFLYVVSGTGKGQTNFLTASTVGSATLKAAFGTSLDTTSRIIKILPRFHKTFSLTSGGLQISSQAAAGSQTAFILDTHIVQNNREAQLDPTKHAAMTGLDSLASLRFEADVIFDTFAYAIG